MPVLKVKRMSTSESKWSMEVLVAGPTNRLSEWAGRDVNVGQDGYDAPQHPARSNITRTPLFVTGLIQQGTPPRSRRSPSATGRRAEQKAFHLQTRGRRTRQGAKF